ncbi:hypothetical protein N7468_002909 [Penicillium chermesinum]|uniref:Uncharacterized protein n=1 Tax=Penicillium chermesinum TaxID=63820 RepID=A0A9W9P630_9EURO|nr:uncharacterized protein N7468_002909 [Penicillium chermesinum]KAJ5238290.1 hypothetical protein N7468_002909 [Penicillium chermesinum]KAJ6163956.1 hypothetical protein N7470_002628 [Penicillium chermesinum]
MQSQHFKRRSVLGAEPVFEITKDHGVILPDEEEGSIHEIEGLTLPDEEEESLYEMENLMEQFTLFGEHQIRGEEEGDAISRMEYGIRL